MKTQNFKTCFYLLIWVTLLNTSCSYSPKSGGENEGLTDEYYVSSNSLDNITIDSDIDNAINNSAIIQQLNFSNDYLNKIKLILSDPNGDPDNLNGTSDLSQEFQCKWCSSTFNQYTVKYTSLQQIIHNLTLDDINVMAKLYSAAINNQFTKENPTEDDMLSYHRQEVESYVDRYINGDRYEQSNLDLSEFCSEKCKTEHDLFN